MSEEGEAGDDHRHGREAVEPVGQVHRIAEGDDHERAEDDVEPAKIEHRPLLERHIEVGRRRVRTMSQVAKPAIRNSSASRVLPERPAWCAFLTLS